MGQGGKNRKLIENILFPALLAVYPLLRIRQGIDVSDATYSLANFQYFTSMDGTWIIATFLSNVTGWLMTHLPFGDTLMGMYAYTALIQSGIAVMAYGALKRRMPAALAFVGEGIALGLCWCPSTVLYNYLTYLLMTAGMLLLYEGILREGGAALSAEAARPAGRAWPYYLAAGICLGANVAVRMPNVVQAAFIAAVWYVAALCGGGLRRAVRDTLWCVLGYALGFGVPLGVISVRYGTDAYPSMVRTMFAMTEKASDYKPASMLTGMLGDYVTGLFWLVFAAACMAGGWLLFALRRRLFAGSRLADLVCKAVYAAVFCVLLRFYWGRGVFTFQYYAYRSMYYPAVLFLLVTIVMAVLCLCRKQTPFAGRIAAALVLIQIFVTPLGSNNDLYPVINHLFVAAPFTLWAVYWQSAGECPRCTKGSPAWGAVWRIPVLMLILFLLIQSVGFHSRFSFQDGIWGERRDNTVSAPPKAAGVYTTKDNAAWLSELAVYVEGAGLTGKRVLLYGDIPGLGYLLDLPSALSTFWPSLDSYLMAEYERDLARMDTVPVIIVESPIGAYLNEDADGMNWFGVNREVLDGDGKLQRLAQYMEAHSYRESFGNGRYVVYVTDE